MGYRFIFFSKNGRGAQATLNVSYEKDFYLELAEFNSKFYLHILFLFILSRV